MRYISFGSSRCICHKANSRNSLLLIMTKRPLDFSDGRFFCWWNFATETRRQEACLSADREHEEEKKTKTNIYRIRHTVKQSVRGIINLIFFFVPLCVSVSLWPVKADHDFLTLNAVTNFLRRLPIRKQNLWQQKKQLQKTSARRSTAGVMWRSFYWVFTFCL